MQLLVQVNNGESIVCLCRQVKEASTIRAIVTINVCTIFNEQFNYVRAGMFYYGIHKCSEMINVLEIDPLLDHLVDFMSDY